MLLPATLALHRIWRIDSRRQAKVASPFHTLRRIAADAAMRLSRASSRHALIRAPPQHIRGAAFQMTRHA